MHANSALVTKNESGGSAAPLGEISIRGTCGFFELDESLVG